MKDQEEMGFFPFYPHFIPINLNLLSGPCHATCPLRSWVCLCPEMIRFFSVQFILNELSSNHFMTSEIFVKILSLDVLKSVECKYSVEVLHVKSLSPLVKDDILYFLHLILM